MQGEPFAVVLYFSPANCDSWAGHYISTFSASQRAFKAGTYRLVLLGPVLWLHNAYCGKQN